jgi:very-short-patch-repair endonuclease
VAERTFRTRRQTLRARQLRRDVSRTESCLWPHLRNSGAGASFRRQHPVGPYFPDYYCVPLKLAVEVDGPMHSAERDSIRDSCLEQLGVTILRFSHQEIEDNLEGVVNTIRQTIWFLQNQGR